MNAKAFELYKAMFKGVPSAVVRNAITLFSMPAIYIKFW
jgi:hypothetical protein